MVILYIVYMISAYDIKKFKSASMAWIDPEGNFIPCSVMHHLSVLAKHPEFIACPIYDQRLDLISDFRYDTFPG